MNLLDLKTASGPARPEPAMSASVTRRSMLASMLGQLDEVYAELDSRD